MNIWWVLVIVKVLSVLEQAATARQSYTSVESIKNILKLDKKIDGYFRQSLPHLDDHNDLILQYIRERESAFPEVGDDSNNAAINPLHAFQAIRRVTVDIYKILKQLRNIDDYDNALRELIENENQTVNYNDLDGAMRGILRLQENYFLAAEDLKNGHIHNLLTSAKLTIGDCLLLAETAKDIGRLDLWVEWVEQAHVICQLKHGSQHCSETTQHLYMSAVQKHDTIREQYARELKRNSTFQIEKRVFRKGVYNMKASLQRKLLNATAVERFPGSERRLCNVGMTTTQGPLPLFCHFLTHPNDPYTTLERYKVEVQSLNPFISFIYDVITPAEAQLFIDLATPQLTRSLVQALKNTIQGGKSDDNRISETAWIRDNDDLRIDKISKRIQRITGLSTSDNDAEFYQVVNYGIGGLYAPHYDFLLSEDAVQERLNDTHFMGNRIATFMLYLSDVERGGATVFPRCEVAVHPKIGSATMWYNLDRNGKPDFNTIHSGCPVLYGSKWIANKWILERGQIFRRPCPASQ